MPKRTPKNLLFRVFFGVCFWTPFGTPFRRLSWTPCPPKTTILLGRSFKNAAPTNSPPRAKKARKSHENDPQNWSKNCKKRVPKMGPEKGTQHIANLKKPQPLSLIFFRGWGSFGRPSTALPTSLTTSLASTSFLFVLCQFWGSFS